MLGIYVGGRSRVVRNENFWLLNLIFDSEMIVRKGIWLCECYVKINYL